MSKVTKTPEQWADFLESVTINYVSFKDGKAIISYTMFAPMGCSAQRGTAILCEIKMRDVNFIREERHQKRVKQFMEDQKERWRLKELEEED